VHGAFSLDVAARRTGGLAFAPLPTGKEGTKTACLPAAMTFDEALFWCMEHRVIMTSSEGESGMITLEASGIRLSAPAPSASWFAWRTAFTELAHKLRFELESGCPSGVKLRRDVLLGGERKTSVA
jgi:hypothetical protein